MAPALRPHQTPASRRRKFALGGRATVAETDKVWEYWGSWLRRV